jgi:hypothetical protein
MNIYPHLSAATTMIGDKIVTSAGEELGTLKELMVDLDEGRVNYVVLAFGGFWGLGDKLFAVPWEALTFNTENHTFILDMDNEQLKNAPGFDKDNWPAEAQYASGWLVDLYDYYGYYPYWMSEPERDIDQER